MNQVQSAPSHSSPHSSHTHLMSQCLMSHGSKSDFPQGSPTNRSTDGVLPHTGVSRSDSPQGSPTNQAPNGLLSHTGVSMSDSPQGSPTNQSPNGLLSHTGGSRSDFPQGSPTDRSTDRVLSHTGGSRSDSPQGSPTDRSTNGVLKAGHLGPIPAPTNNMKVNGKTLKVALLNARSVCNKTEAIQELVADNSFSITCLTETWLRDGDTHLIGDFCPPHHYFIGAPRPVSKGKVGGGVGCILSSCLKATEMPQKEFKTFEYVCIKVKGKFPMHIVVLYRPPPSAKNGHTLHMFLDEFDEFLSTLCTEITGNLCIMGDFNLHWDIAEDSAVSRFKEILDNYELQQLVESPTHTGNHTLDLIITRKDYGNKMSVADIWDTGLSDHFLITCDMELNAEHALKGQITCRPLKRVNSAHFAADLNAGLSVPAADDIECQTNHFLDVSLLITDKHAPTKKITIKGDGSKPWYSDEIHKARVVRRRMERKYRRTGLAIHKQIYLDHSKKVMELIKQSKRKYFHDKFACSSTKETFKLINNLLHSNTSKVLPTGKTDQELAESFSEFFTAKILNIRSVMDQGQSAADGGIGEHSSPTKAILSNFSVQTVAEVRAIIKRSATKTCSLDSIPTALLKEEEVCETVLPALTNIINSSLDSGIVPKRFKEAVITPSLKNTSLDAEELKSYRPISNICFPAKVMEKIVAAQITEHMTRNGLHDPLQSAYRKKASTETALIKIKCDVDRMLDAGEAVMLIFLDLSAAFDMIDHAVLLGRLKEEVGITDLALRWIESYLQDRKQSVKINDCSSSPSYLSIGVPQGSVLGPLLFLCYMLPLQKIVEKHGIYRHAYADDTQVYCPLTLSDNSQRKRQVKRMEDCLEEISQWMLVNKLKLNASKTEMLVVTRKSFLTASESIQVHFGDATITPQRVVKNLGAIFDHEMSMAKQAQHATKSAYFHLRRISKIRPYISKKACAAAIHSTVTSRLDYHNGLLLGAPKSITKRMQVAQNSAARLLTQTSKREHITPILAQLHWLPVEKRISYKALCMVHSAIHDDCAPLYLKDMCQMYVPRRALRSDDDNFKLVVSNDSNSYGRRAFDSCAFRLWNCLPLALRMISKKDCFMRALKTFFYIESYQN